MHHMKEYRVSDVAELSNIAKEVRDALIDMMKHSQAAGVLALHGDLGAGKTTFMQILAHELGITEVVTSPTFVIMKKYDVESEAVKQFIHIDAYRIENIDEMRPLRLKEELASENTMIGIEWAEKIKELLPKNTLHMQFTIEGEDRIITLTHGKES